MKTIICDIDGTIFKYSPTGHDAVANEEPEILPGVKEQFNAWEMAGHRIILITGRRESQRKDTEKQLREFGLFWDHLIMGVGGGDRVLINDKKPDSVRDTANAINLKRNEGIKNVKI